MGSCCSSCLKTIRGEMIDSLVGKALQSPTEPNSPEMELTSIDLIEKYSIKFSDKVYDPSSFFISSLSSGQNAFELALLGSSDSGKTTFLKQFMLYINFFAENERKQYIRDIIINILRTIQSIVQHLRLIDKFIDFENEDLIEELNEIDISKMKPGKFESILYDKIVSIWNDPIITNAYSEKQEELDLPQFIPYYIQHVSNYKADNYIPSEEEIVKVRILTTESTNSTAKNFGIVLNGSNLLFKDIGGLLYERENWKNLSFDGAIFFVPIGDFDLPMKEDPKMMRFMDHINLFEETLQNSFKGTKKPLFVVFTKYDLFCEKIQKKKTNNFSTFFPDFEGDSSNPEQCQEHVVKLFANSAYYIDPNIPLKIINSVCCINKEEVLTSTKLICKHINFDAIMKKRKRLI